MLVFSKPYNEPK